jgi:DNA primase
MSARRGLAPVEETDMIDDWTIRKIKDAANIMDVIDDFYHGQYRKSGTDYVMLCPFHPDRHMGNFKISPRRNRCTCFS